MKKRDTSTLLILGAVAIGGYFLVTQSASAQTTQGGYGGQGALPGGGSGGQGGYSGGGYGGGGGQMGRAPVRRFR